MERRSSRGLLAARGADTGEALLEIPDQIVDVLDSDREANRSRADARGLELLLVELAVRRARRVNDQALRVADVREMRPECHAADEVLARFAAALELEREDRARAARQILVDELTVPARAQPRVRHSRDELVRGEILRHRL